MELRDIPGFPDYKASTSGDIVSFVKRTPHVLHRGHDRDGYPTTTLRSPDGRARKLLIHRLIAAAFLPPRPSPRHEVRHRDGNKENSAPDNLMWGTQKDNADDREEHGRTARGPKIASAKLSETEVIEMRRLHGEGCTKKSLGKRFGVSDVMAGKICNGIYWRHLA